MTILCDHLGRLERFGADVAEWAVDEFLLQGRPETFYPRGFLSQMLFIIGVVVAVAGTAHALRHAMLLEKFSAGMTCILHTAITVMNKTNRWRPALHGHHQRICSKRRVQRVRHAPPHDYPSDFGSIHPSKYQRDIEILLRLRCK